MTRSSPSNSGRTPRGPTPARRPRAGARPWPRGRGRDPVEAEIAKRIAAGGEADAFLCIDCFCWSLEPAFCGCWTRAIFLE